MEAPWNSNLLFYTIVLKYYFYLHSCISPWPTLLASRFTLWKLRLGSGIHLRGSGQAGMINPISLAQLKPFFQVLTQILTLPCNWLRALVPIFQTLALRQEGPVVFVFEPWTVPPTQSATAGSEIPCYCDRGACVPSDPQVCRVPFLRQALGIQWFIMGGWLFYSDRVKILLKLQSFLTFLKLWLKKKKKPVGENWSPPQHISPSALK